MIATKVLDCVSEHIVGDIRFHCLSVAVQKDILGLWGLICDVCGDMDIVIVTSPVIYGMLRNEEKYLLQKDEKIKRQNNEFLHYYFLPSPVGVEHPKHWLMDHCSSINALSELKGSKKIIESDMILYNSGKFLVFLKCRSPDIGRRVTWYHPAWR